MSNASIDHSLSLEIEQSGSQAIVHCHGRLVAEAGEVLYSRIRELIPVNNSIVLDLADLAFVDSMGLGSLVRAHVSCRSGGARLQLVNVGKQIRELLDITKLFPVFMDIS